jgi:hypothetical protein
MSRTGEVVEPPAESVGQRLGLVVELGAGELAPAPVAAQLDESGAELDAEEEPPQQQDRRPRHRRVVASEERGEEAELEQQRLPPEAVPDLADVDVREVQAPQEQERDGRRCRAQPLRDAEHGRGGDREADRREGGRRSVRRPAVEQARCAAEGHALDEPAGRRETVFPEEGPPLRQDVGEREDEQDTRSSLQQLARDPQFVRAEELHARSVPPTTLPDANAGERDTPEAAPRGGLRQMRSTRSGERISPRVGSPRSG